MDDMM